METGNGTRTFDQRSRTVSNHGLPEGSRSSAVLGVVVDKHGVGGGDGRVGLDPLHGVEGNLGEARRGNGHRVCNDTLPDTSL